jgi:hypothetical protein
MTVTGTTLHGKWFVPGGLLTPTTSKKIRSYIHRRSTGLRTVTDKQALCELPVQISAMAAEYIFALAGYELAVQISAAFFSCARIS